MSTETKATTCAVWVRVSTAEQDTGNQAQALRMWAQARGLTVVHEYVMHESAWTGTHKKQLAIALDDARKGDYDVLLVWALDRLSRQGIMSMGHTMADFTTAGAMVWSHQESWTETADPHIRELIMAIMAWVAEQESSRRSERTKAGMARKAREDPTFRPGRQRGSKDKQPRKRSGYYARYERERGAA